MIDAFVRAYFAVTSSLTKAFVEPHIIGVGLIAAVIDIAAIQSRSAILVTAQRTACESCG